MKSLSAQRQSSPQPQQGAGTFAKIPSNVPYPPDQPDSALMVSGWRRFLCLAPTFVLGLLILVTLAAPLIAPYDPLQGSLQDRISPPGTGVGGASHILGADHVGRDVFSRIIHSFRNALIISAPVLAAAAIPGVIIALLAVQFAGWTDKIVTFLADIELPPILIAAVLMLVFGYSRLYLFIALWLWAFPYCVRLVRDEAFSLQSGNGHWVQQPAALIASILAAVVSLAGIIVLAETTLSFLGLGVPPPNLAWGSMVANGRQYLVVGWWISVFPGLAIALTLLTLSFTAVGLRVLFRRS